MFSDSHIRVLVKRLTAVKTIASNQITERIPSPRTYATKSVIRVPKTTHPPESSGTYVKEKIAAIATNATTALSLTLSLVRHAMYALSTIPATSGSHRIFDTKSAYSKGDFTWFIGFVIGVLGFASFALTKNLLLSAFFFGVAFIFCLAATLYEARTLPVLSA
jgi:hypothetical protein